MYDVIVPMVYILLGVYLRKNSYALFVGKEFAYIYFFYVFIIPSGFYNIGFLETYFYDMARLLFAK